MDNVPAKLVVASVPNTFASHGECDTAEESACNDQNVLPPLPTGSPPLPFDPPPTPPPLPPSPPPLQPPPPSSPPPPPPPETYLAHNASHPNQLFQPVISSVQHIPSHLPPPQATLSHPLPSSQMPSNHPTYGNPMTHQVQQQYGQRQYNIEEQWRPHPADANPENSGAWMAGGKTPCSGAPFVQDGMCHFSYLEESASNLVKSMMYGVG
ncbi:hypothetical protein KSP40_PGU016382 [Platanthera guangdongensis]|uniref:Uncharacterized protein n=1 Tax=Platanthera guangdongensis TaxID=2320717 RepID=A0ABR2MY93_9ASPA